MIFHRPSARLNSRRAFTMIEVAATSLMVGIAMVLMLQLLTVVASERRSLDRRQCATQEVANQMEYLTRLRWDELSPDQSQAPPLSARAKAMLPGAEFTLKVSSTTEPKGKRLSLSLRWRNRHGEWDSPVRLSSWVYPRGGVQ